MRAADEGWTSKYSTDGALLYGTFGNTEESLDTVCADTVPLKQKIFLFVEDPNSSPAVDKPCPFCVIFLFSFSKAQAYGVFQIVITIVATAILLLQSEPGYFFNRGFTIWYSTNTQEINTRTNGGNKHKEHNDKSQRLSRSKKTTTK